MRPIFLMQFLSFVFMSLKLWECEAFIPRHSGTRSMLLTRPLAVAYARTTMRSATTSEQNSNSCSVEFSEEEQKVLRDLHSEASDNQDLLPELIRRKLTQISPTLIVKLRQATQHPDENVRVIATTLNEILDEQLQQAKETLRQLLNAGEIRKLDNLIGKAAREGRLNVPFFNVLNMNMQDAATAPDEEAAATRLQILQHVYTRCQEEVEKTIAPATALLNKLLRTNEDSIRRNIYQHYLAPQTNNTITTPTGETIQLQGQRPPLIPITEFVNAIATAVKQIRTVENAGAVNPVTSAAMVEQCRTIAKEARVIIGETYGVDSMELLDFEEGLQPVFRPSSASSVYIQGEAASTA